MTCAKALLNITLAAVLAACSTPSKQAFSQNVKRLELGKTTATQCRNHFGNPTSTEEIDGPTGKFEIMRYHIQSDRATLGYSRSLLLELKEGTLNGYSFASSFREDQTKFDRTNISKIEWAVSTQKEVRELLGEPHGRIKCPTEIPPLASRCNPLSGEFWIYNDWQGIPLLIGKGPIRFATGTACQVAFDKYGIVTEVITLNRAGEQSSQPLRR